MGTITEDNFLVWNQGKNPLVNFNFMLRVEMLFDLPCKSVRAFTREMEYDYIQEGGLNDYVHMLRKPISKPFTLEVERYVGVDYVDPMPLGANLTLPVLLFVGRAPNQFIPGLVARTYVFTGCTVMKKVYGDLVGDQSGLLVETTTLGYREMLCVDIPWSAVKTDVGAGYATPPGNSAAEERRAKAKAAEEARAKAEAEQAEESKTTREERQAKAKAAEEARKKAEAEQAKKDAGENKAAREERQAKAKAAEESRKKAEAEQAKKDAGENKAAREERRAKAGTAEEAQNGQNTAGTVEGQGEESQEPV